MSDHAPNTYDRRYLRLLFLYSPEWQADNGAAVLAALKEQHEAAGRRYPSVSDRASFAVAGAQQRLFQPLPLTPWSLATAVLLALSTSAAAWYLTAVIWHPGLSLARLGPFDNGMPFAAIPMLGGLVFALTRRDGAARLCAGLAAASTLVIAAMQPVMNWPGPGPQVVVFFVGLNLLALRAGTLRATIAVALALSLALVASPLLYDVRGMFAYYADSTWWGGAALAAVVAIVCIALLVSAWRIPTDHATARKRGRGKVDGGRPAD